MNCPHCSCQLDPREVLKLAQREISKAYWEKQPKRTEAQRKADLLAKLHRRASKPVREGCWSFEIFDEPNPSLRIGSYRNRDSAIGAIEHCRKNFPEYRWKLIMHDPEGKLWIPKRGRVPGEILYQCVGPAANFKR